MLAYAFGGRAPIDLPGRVAHVQAREVRTARAEAFEMRRKGRADRHVVGTDEERRLEQ
jgi:hypothetical protein